MCVCVSDHEAQEIQTLDIPQASLLTTLKCYYGVLTKGKVKRFHPNNTLLLCSTQQRYFLKGSPRRLVVLFTKGWGYDKITTKSNLVTSHADGMSGAKNVVVKRTSFLVQVRLGWKNNTSIFLQWRFWGKHYAVLYIQFLHRSQSYL